MSLPPVSYSCHLSLVTRNFLGPGGMERKKGFHDPPNKIHATGMALASVVDRMRVSQDNSGKAKNERGIGK